jgi:hypothetical protein
MSNESEQARALKNGLIKFGHYAIKIHQQGFTDAGIPDLLCCINGWFVGIELKMLRGGKKVVYSDHQILHLKNIEVAGGKAYGVVYGATRLKDRWALDEKKTGQTDHLEWRSLAGIVDLLRSLPTRGEITTPVPLPLPRMGQTEDSLSRRLVALPEVPQQESQIQDS